MLLQRDEQNMSNENVKKLKYFKLLGTFTKIVPNRELRQSENVNIQNSCESLMEKGTKNDYVCDIYILNERKRWIISRMSGGLQAKLKVKL